MANDELILITGATGHLGFRTLVFALQHGYRVRAAVRSLEKASLIRSAESIRNLSGLEERLEFVEVPDILAEGAYDAAVEGVVGVVHVASPISFPTDDYDRDLINPAVQGTVGILKSAAKVLSIKRVVITSSEVAIIPFRDFAQVESETVFTDKMSIPPPQPPYANYFAAYAASKVHALHASEKFIADNKPDFDIINIMPSFIIGKNELTTSIEEMRTKGTNRHALTPLIGIKNPNPNPSTTVFADDIAKIHVLAVDPKIPGGQNFLASSGGIRGTTWNDSSDIVKKHFPDEVARGVWPLDGSQPTKSTKVDSSRTEEVFGFKLADYETQVKSVVGHYLELLQKAEVAM